MLTNPYVKPYVYVYSDQFLTFSWVLVLQLFNFTSGFHNYIRFFLLEFLGIYPYVNSLTSACSITFLNICDRFLWTFSKFFCIIKQFSLSWGYAAELYQKDFASDGEASWKRVKLINGQQFGGGRSRNSVKNKKQSNTL